MASILIHLDFLSISLVKAFLTSVVNCFNPYSPGFSIYFVGQKIENELKNSFNPYSPGFSIYLLGKYTPK